MTLHCRAAVLHQAHSPLQIEMIAAAPIAPSDVLVRVRAAGLCHADLGVVDSSPRQSTFARAHPASSGACAR